MDFCIYDDILGTIQITDNNVLHFKLSKSGQILHVSKTGFPKPSHKFGLSNDVQVFLSFWNRQRNTFHYKGVKHTRKIFSSTADVKSPSVSFRSTELSRL